MAELQCITTDIVQVATPFPKLTFCHDKQTYLETAIIQKEIYQKFATISLSYGNRHAGFLGIMMPVALYAQCFNALFQPPHDLGKYHNDIPTNVSIQWSKILICHKAVKQVYNTSRQ